jgi:hypothetical protein
MGFDVADIETTVAELKARGVVFEDYDAPGRGTRDGDIAEIEGDCASKDASGERGASFRDGEGNPRARATRPLNMIRPVSG